MYIIIIMNICVYIVRIIESSNMPLHGLLNQRKIAFITFSSWYNVFMVSPSRRPKNIFRRHTFASHVRTYERTKAHILLYIIYPIAIIMSSSNISIKMIVHWPSEMNCFSLFFSFARKWYAWPLSSPLPTIFAFAGVFFHCPYIFFVSLASTSNEQNLHKFRLFV